MRDSTMTNYPMRPTPAQAPLSSLQRACRLLPKLTLAGLLCLASGCLYRMPIQQGNFLDPNQVAQLETGMTRSQVMFLLGTPMVPNGFNTDRWDYYYYVKGSKRGVAAYTRRLTVYFKDEKVERVERDDATAAATPATAAAPAAVATPAATDAPAAAAASSTTTP